MKKIVIVSFALLLRAAAYADNMPKAADIVVAGIELGNAPSAVKVLGSKDEIDHTLDMPQAVYQNKARTEQMALVFFPGSVKNEYSSYVIASSKKGNKASSLNVESFITGKGIKLGLSSAEVISKLGEPTRTEKKGDTTVLTYVLDEQNAAEFLKRYNLPEYDATYEFKKGVLRTISAGFVYP